MRKPLISLLIGWLMISQAALAQPLTDAQLTTQFDKVLADQFKPGESGCSW